MAKTQHTRTAQARKAYPRATNIVKASDVIRLDEDDIQTGCVFWFGMQYPHLRRLIHHSPNEDAYKHAKRANSMGMQKGFPDIFIAVPRGVYHGLFIEMKTPEGRARPEQKEMLALLSGQGYYCAIAHGQQTFRTITTKYLSLAHGETM